MTKTADAANAEAIYQLKNKRKRIRNFLIGLLLFVFFLFLFSKNMPPDKKIRQPAVSGQFYPASSGELKRIINFYLEKAESAPDPKARAIIVPHAGYVYSGEVAAYSFGALTGRRVENVILIGNSHTGYFEGVAVDDNNFWQTPLGEVEVNTEMAKKFVKRNNFIKFDGQVHAHDHVLEVELPFLQVALAKGFKIVPLLFGNGNNDDYKDLAEAIIDVLGENDLMVISSDMSHYPPYEEAGKIDAGTLEFIKRKDIDGLDEHILSVMSSGVPNEQTLVCSPDAIKTVMEIAGQLDWEAEILKYANSGDAPAGDKSGVVGYGAVVFQSKNNAPASRRENEKFKNNLMGENLNAEQKNTLLEIARETVETFVKEKRIKDFKIDDERLNRKEGAFVTLHRQGELRGCIGQVLPPDTPLWQNVRDMAIAAAVEDFRFLPVIENELPSLNYEISVLSRPETIDNWQKVELGKHGAIISKGANKGVFLPQVAKETGWDKEKFLSELCSQKAGLEPDCYKNNPLVKIEVFTAQVFSEKEIK